MSLVLVVTNSIQEVAGSSPCILAFLRFLTKSVQHGNMTESDVQREIKFVIQPNRNWESK